MLIDFPYVPIHISKQNHIVNASHLHNLNGLDAAFKGSVDVVRRKMTLLFLAANMGVIGIFKKETTIPVLLNQSMIVVGAVYGVPAVYAEMLTLA